MLLSNGTSVLWNLQHCSNVMRFKDLVFFVMAPGASAYLHSFALKKSGVWAILRKTVQSWLVISTQAICIAPFVQEGRKTSSLTPFGSRFPLLASPGVPTHATEPVRTFAAT